MKLIIQEITTARTMLLCLILIITVITSSVKSLKSNKIEAAINSDNSDEIESNRININNNNNNQTNKIKKANLKINFKFANVSLVFPQPLEQFRLSYNEFIEENRKSINPLLIPNNNNEKSNSNNRNFLNNNNEISNSFNTTSSRITVNDKPENLKCIKFFLNSFTYMLIICLLQNKLPPISFKIIFL